MNLWDILKILFEQTKKLPELIKGKLSDAQKEILFSFFRDLIELHDIGARISQNINEYDKEILENADERYDRLQVDLIRHVLNQIDLLFNLFRSLNQMIFTFLALKDSELGMSLRTILHIKGGILFSLLFHFESVILKENIKKRPKIKIPDYVVIDGSEINDLKGIFKLKYQEDQILSKKIKIHELNNMQEIKSFKRKVKSNLSNLEENIDIFGKIVEDSFSKEDIVKFMIKKR